MNAKATILNNIKLAQNSKEIVLPSLHNLGQSFDNKYEKFSEMLRLVGGEAILLEERDINKVISNLFPDVKIILSHIDECDLGTIKTNNPHELDSLELAVINGEFAVAENGAVWVQDTADSHRAATFMAENIVLVVDKNSIVNTMNDAYSNIRFDKKGFGVFVSGPSKTADIEQSLVIGAHGAKTTYVVFV